VIALYSMAPVDGIRFKKEQEKTSNAIMMQFVNKNVVLNAVKRFTEISI
jgi:hypothetical protein